MAVVNNHPTIAILLQTVSGVLSTGFTTQLSDGYAVLREPLPITPETGFRKWRG